MSNPQEQEKPSKTRQWQERSERPIASRPMSPQEIVAFMKTLADSYKCEVSEITYDFEKIQDENDTDRDDCLWLMYRMKCVIGGKPGTRDIFRIKLPIPDEVRRAGEMARQQQAKRGRRNLVIMPPAQAANTVQTPQTSNTAQTSNPVQTPQTPQTSNTVQTPQTPQINVSQSDNSATQSVQSVDPTPAPAPTVAVPKVRRPIKRK
jgi:hypothetical protein